VQLIDLIADVRDRVQDQSAGTFQDAQITRWLNMALDDLSEVANYEAEPYTFSTVAGQNAYPIPADCLHGGIRRIVWTLPQSNPTPLTFIDRDDYDEWVMSGALNSTQWPLGVPLMYTVWGKYVYILPTPQQNGFNDMTVYYYAQLPHLVNQTDIPAIPANRHEALVLYAVARCMEYLEESAMFAEYMQQYEAQKQALEEQVSNTQRDMPRMVREVWY
jgi:hypothetical protein